jgi:hypothetical protein
METLDHPAVAVAVAALTVADPDPRPVAAIIRDDTVAVLVDCEQGRCAVFVQLRDGHWVAPGMIIGSTRPDKPRADRTPDYMPLHRKSTKRFAHPSADGTPQDEGWFAVTGLAAHDAVSVSVRSELDDSITPISEDGLAFAIVRARWTEEPDVYVHTSDGRRVSATLRLAG